ncbi:MULTISPECIES: hypothetical protein [Kitasatospora]|uniref:Uncharacterized protein n=1 Tax=Kitasatospora cathayae TaxID=3004092 RepID=A0ABY7Q7H7_9ACTN|nr:hypothetical protein [Kitasatospora sp. HUAS 3-15]WBP88572.1 hypothetical protein O1G21_23820 [Kitasatospora sp. HUAS 3-15]
MGTVEDGAAAARIEPGADVVERAGEPPRPAGPGLRHCLRTGEHCRETYGTLAPA